MLFTPSHFTNLATRAALNLQSIHRFGKDYARTLAEWDQRFVSAAPAIQAQGFDERFMRMWRFYLAYCQAGFLSGSTDVAQFSFVRA
jgi:cyclopropane-fatty-acyl-phospholipid synthase